ncbi:ComF family protein [Dehalobacterium formicoaceticum]|uniref:ComF family protein n=1 Tax=Dehalobacterium formicoaceticum TaxID=51515 RepID=A0ABT1Y3D4_9FIRM|nr:ComF family protein [Dehalobacterium formicoaceticum]
MSKLMGDWWQALLNLIFPHCRCIACGEEVKLDNTGLCGNCRRIIQDETMIFHSCASCPTFIPLEARYCLNCLREPPWFFDAGIAVFPYQDDIRQVLQDFKYRGTVKWAKPLGTLMAEAVLHKLPFHNITTVIPVPLHPNRERTRGYNQSELLAREIGRRLDVRVEVSILLRIKDTPSQTGLSKEGRRENMHEAFQIGESGDLTGKTVLLVDDIYTTGTTVNTCSRILKEAGAKAIFVATCAAGKRY